MEGGYDHLEVFVSCLPYACDERQLFDLFDDYFPVIHARIVRSEKNGKRISQMYGFVTLGNPEDVNQAVDLLDQHLFKGRRIKVEAASRKQGMKRPGGPAVHVSMKSPAYRNPDGQIVPAAEPSELMLRRYLCNFGIIHDVQINMFTFNERTQSYEGFGFVTFKKRESVEMILSRQHAYGRPIEYRVGELVVSFKSTFRSTERGTGIGGMFAMGDDLSYDYDDDRSFFNGSTGPSSMHGHSMHGRTPLPLSLGSGSSGFPTSNIGSSPHRPIPMQQFLPIPLPNTYPLQPPPLQPMHHMNPGVSFSVPPINGLIGAGNMINENSNPLYARFGPTI